MRFLITILLVIAQISANAYNHYYVSPTGNNSNAGTQASPFLTAAKGFSVLVKHDTLSFEGGKTWNESVKMPVDSIVINAYGTGNATFTGLQTVTSWTNVSGNVWSASVPNAPDSLNTVLINGVLVPKSKYPNGYVGYAVYNASLSTDSTLKTSLPDAPSYVGMELVIRDVSWIIDVVHITAQSGGVLSFTPKLTYTPVSYMTGFFIQNDVSLIDSTNEWAWNAATKTLYVFSVGSPANVQASIIDTLLWVSKNDGVSIDGINFTGANKTAIQIDTTAHFTLTNSTIKNCGGNGITGYKSPYVTIKNCYIDSCFNDGVYLRSKYQFQPTIDSCKYAYLDHDTINNIGLYPGMGRNGNGNYVGIYAIGDSSKINYARIKNTGYCGIMWNGKRDTIYRAYVDSFGLIKDDGGGIYTTIGSYLPTAANDSSVIMESIVGNGIGSTTGYNVAGFTTKYAIPIYLDDNSRRITVSGSTSYNGLGFGLILNTGVHNYFLNNVIDDSLGDCIYMAGASSATQFNTFYSNIYNQRSTAFVASRVLGSGSIVQTSDSNYYVKPRDTTTAIRYGSTNYAYSAFVAATGFDVHGGTQPAKYLAGLNSVLFINPSEVTITIALDQSYMDVYGNFYNTSVDIEPFKSKILFPCTISISKHYTPH